MEITISPTTNHEVIATLNEEVQTWHHENYPNEFKPFNYEEVAAAQKTILASEGAFALVAKTQETPIGYILGFVKSRPESSFQYAKTTLFINQIAVLANHRAKGVGKQLLQQAYEHGKANGATEVELDHWANNEFLKNFFPKQGFNYFNFRMKKTL